MELILIALFLWLCWKVLGLALRAAWGAAKIAAFMLFVCAVPALVLCLIFAGGFLLLIPIAMAAAALGILKAVV